MNNEETYDVIIVGAGGSGLAAAVSAAEEGLNVAVIEKEPSPGGTTAIAVGSLTANRTDWQERKGIRDELNWHEEDAGLFAPQDIECKNNIELRRYFLNHARESLNWLQKMGLEFVGPSPEPPNRVARMHNVVPNGRAYIHALKKKLDQLGGRLMCNACVTKLIYKKDRIHGVCIRQNKDDQDWIWTAHFGVIIASGDYANAADLITRFKGPSFSRIEGINPKANGEGHRLIESVGGALVNMEITYGPELRFPPPEPSWIDHVLSRPGVATWVGALVKRLPVSCLAPFIKRLLVTWQHPEDSLFREGAILVNREGKRFCEETRSPEREIALANQTCKEGFILMDERLVRTFQAWPHFISTAPQIAYAYIDDYLRFRPDIARASSTLDSLCKKTGIPLEPLKESIKKWNDTARNPLKGRRWVMMGPVKAWFTTTEGGAAINREFQVLNKEGQPIAGLYAVGQSGLGGQILWGHGLHIAWAITSGRLVGKVLSALKSKAK